VRRARRLATDRSARREEGLFIVEGPVLAAEAVASRLEILEQFVLAEAAAIPGIETHVVDDQVLASVSDVETARGPVLVCRVPPQVDLSSVQGWVIVADAVSDPGNLGTISRCAEIAGASAVVVTRGATDQWSPKCVRASAGASFHVPIVEVDSLADVRDAGFTIVASTSHEHPGGAGSGSGSPVIEMELCDFSGRVALVLGNESRGVPADAPVDRWVTIGHVGRGESLNVAMAGAILSHHISRVRAGR